MRALRMIAGAIVVLAGWLAIGSGVAAAAGTGASISAVEGQQLTSVVDHISQCDLTNLHSITIDWGDGATSAGTAAAGAGPRTCDISGTHTYAEEGSYITTVSYTMGTGSRSDTGSATVADAPVTATRAGDFTASAGSAFSGVVAHWSDSVPEVLSSYSATIDWGDGTTTAGGIGSNGDVTGGHTYASGGRFAVTVTFHDEGGASATAVEHATVSGCGTSGASATLIVPSISGLNARYVEAIYHDILGRSASASELTAATGALSAGATRSELALTLLDSPEYRARVVASDYHAYLRRAPSPSETSAFVALLGSHSDEAVAAQFLGSSEYFASRGHQSPDGFLSALYCDALMRPIDLTSQNADEAALGSGTSRRAIASSVLGSSEYRSRLIRGLYENYLRRDPTSSEVASWSSFLHGGGSDEGLIASLVSSAEYFASVNPSVADPAPLIVQGNTLITTLTRNATLTLSVYRILPAGHASAVRVRSPHTRLVGVVNFGFHRKGHIKLHWNRRVNNHRLEPGRYLLVLKAFVVHKPYHKPYLTRRLIGISDAVHIRIR